jgi:dTDP-4-amino-4,6-dideoxygalactose transaminase
MPFKVPFVNLPAHYAAYRDQYLATIDQVLAAGQVILRQEVRDFEAHFAEYIGVRHAVGVNSGFDSIHLTLRAIGFAPGDEIITVSHTCIATVGAIVNAGAKPVLVDIADDCNIDPDAIEAAITPKTRAIVPVHLDGRPCNMERIMEIATARGLLVIEDGAQAVGAAYAGRRVGSYGVAAGYSLYPFKMLGAFGDAGVMVTNDDEIARRVRYLRDYGQVRETGVIEAFGFNARLDNVQAAILDLRLPMLEGWIERRLQIADRYHAGLSGVGDLILPLTTDPKALNVYLNYIIRNGDRDGLRGHLLERGVETLISLAHPVHTHPALGFQGLRLPKTEEVAQTYQCLPIFPEMTDAQVDFVIESIRAYYETERREGAIEAGAARS